MNEEFNPYTNQPYTEPLEPNPPEAPKPNMPPRYPTQQQGYPYPPQYSNANRLYQPPKSSTAARAFGVVSLVIGCFALMITSMIFFNFRSTVSTKFSQAMTASVCIALPGLIFGIVSVMKKPDKKLFAILGIAFAAVLMLCAFITYFFMVNMPPETIYDL